MKIDSSKVGMESARSYKTSNTAVRRFAIRDFRNGMTQNNNALNTAIGNQAGNAGNREGTGGATNRTVTTMMDWQTRFQTTRSNLSIRSSVSQTYASFREQTIRYIFDMLFAARRGRLNQWMDEHTNQSEGEGVLDESWSQDAKAQNPWSQNVWTQNTWSQNTGPQNLWYFRNGGSTVSQYGSQNMTVTPLVTNMNSLIYSQENYSEESEQTGFSTVGTVRTADGREINFNVNVGMSREFQQYYKEDLELAPFAMCDPLVINLDTDVAQLQDQTFYFDIDADGELDEVSQLGSGSGYLALDKNGDGVINDGSELFGTASGNGFADLAKYDEDGNGWIDENDAIWDKLKIWTKDENGNDVLYRLAEKGVGAICLQNVSTDFTQKGASGQTLGAIRNTGVFLYENGNVGTVQHVDVAKYYKEA